MKGPTKQLRAATPGLWRENMSDQEQTGDEGDHGLDARRLGYEV